MTHDLKGTAAKLAKLVEEEGSYEFEGFSWLPTTIEGVADYLSKHKNTIRKIIDKPPFHYITRNTEEDGRHILLKLGTELCETDHVFKLRAIWSKGLIIYNKTLATHLTMKVMYFKQIGAEKKLYERLLVRIAEAEKGAKNLEKLKAGEKVPLNVPPSHMGQLRGVVQKLGDDATNVTASLVTFEGWTRFMAYLKTAEREMRHLHWPYPGAIKDNPDLALQAYLDDLQEEQKIEPADSARLLAKINELKPQ
ncbi:hypothetical protein ABDF71_20220 [Ochrobactrum sp. WV_118_8]|uniref:hypothetical protein n=1 Tax=Brucella anthropi TaxID=529 RepID=UPI00215723F2|nr:hypothetical protein [Brucella anthropi]MCR8493154.1 hypothetical protein [Brucella anthropi]